MPKMVQTIPPRGFISLLEYSIITNEKMYKARIRMPLLLRRTASPIFCGREVSGMKQTAVLAGLQDYWTVRSDSYSQQNLKEMGTWKRKAWREKILSNAPENAVLDILDVGTGPGFFAVNLALAGHHLTAVDVTGEMLRHARENAAAYGAKVRFLLQNGDSLPFPDASFDLVVNRNVLWNLERPKQALSEWCRVLRPGGRLVYFDANWYLYLFDPQVAKMREENLQRQANREESHMPDEKVRLLESIARKLPLSRCHRPEWDSEALRECGMTIVNIQDDIGPEVLDHQEWMAYRPNPMFMVCAEKGGGDH